jgi:hypothetical protein
MWWINYLGPAAVVAIGAILVWLIVIGIRYQERPKHLGLRHATRQHFAIRQKTPCRVHSRSWFGRSLPRLGSRLVQLKR